MSTEMVTCPSCGNAVPANSRFCPECAYNLSSYAQATGHLPSLSPGTPTLELGALSSEEYAQVLASSQAPTSMYPQTGGAEQPGVGAPTGIQPQPQPQNLSLVPLAHDELTIPPPPVYSESRMLQPAEFQPGGPIQTYPTFSQHNVTYGSYQVQVDDDPPKNPLIGFLLELLGMVGFLGIGQMYAGHVPRGITMMIGWFVYGVFLLLIIISTNVVNFIISCLRIGDLNCLTYPFLAIFILVPILSGFAVHSELEANVRRRAGRQ